MCLDLLDADWRKDPEQLDCKRTGQAFLERDRPYLDHETDPLRWDGRRSGFPLARHSFSARDCGGNDMFNMNLAHLVIGPDLEGPLRRQEEGTYPEVDFDLNGKNVRAKYIRIGREPGFDDDYFCLDKVLIYAKPGR